MLPSGCTQVVPRGTRVEGLDDRAPEPRFSPPHPRTHIHRFPQWGRPSGLLRGGEFLARQLDPVAEGTVALHLALDLVDRMDDGRVVAPAEGLADLDELHLQEVAGQVHGDLARDGEGLDAGLGAEPL